MLQASVAALEAQRDQLSKQLEAERAVWASKRTEAEGTASLAQQAQVCLLYAAMRPLSFCCD